MQLRNQKSDVVLALFVISVACMLLVPLPTALLDLLLVVNLSFSILLLLVALYMQSALSLLAFPTILLLSTLFRLGLNVASSRLILSQGEAGAVINAFGNFLIQGEIVVGIIIFTIVTIVNFIVIARGATRVSEVAARFSLDALPGKQMAIDSDLRSGLIPAQEAQRRREDLRKESQLYGSMDGSMKFVQGDAIAGFFIILANIVGGLYLGISRGQAISEAMHTYTILTIGDGLVSQIPALLTSICAGIVVTRVSSGDNTTLGSDIGSQLFAQPSTLIITGFLITLVGLLPGLPVIPFVVVAISFFVLAYIIQRRITRTGKALPVKREQIGISPVPALYAPSEDEIFEKDVVVLRVDTAGLYRQYKAAPQRYLTYWRQFVDDFYALYGVLLPDLQVLPQDSLRSYSFEIYLQQTCLDSFSGEADWVLAEINPESAHSLGIEVFGECPHPFDGTRLTWALNNPLLQSYFDGEMVRCFDQLEFAILRIGALARHSPDYFISSAEIHAGLKHIEKRHPGFLGESLNRDFISISRFTEICYALVREGISIRDLRQIVEVLSQYCSTIGKDHLEDGVYDLAHIVAYFRVVRKKSLLNNQLSRDGYLRVITLSDKLEEYFLQSKNVGSPFATTHLGQENQKAVSHLQAIIGPLLRRGVMPVSCICRPESRLNVATHVAQHYPFLSVFAFDELDPKTRLQQVGVWSI
jgi:type III secretion protein V